MQSFWRLAIENKRDEEIEINRKKEELIKKRILQNPIFNDFSTEACKTVLIELLKSSGCQIVLKDEEFDYIISSYLKILSLLDSLPLNLTNSHTMIHVAAHLQSYCKMLAKENFLITKYSIHHVILPALIVGAKLASDEAIFLRDFVHCAEKLNLRLFSIKTLAELEINYLTKLGYDVKVSTLDACYTYSKVKEVESKAPQLRWTYFFEAYSSYAEETKSIGVYEELFVLRPKC